MADESRYSKNDYQHMSLFWTDLMHLMFSKPQALTSAGPMRNFAENTKKVSVEMIEASEHLKKFNESLSLYYQQMMKTWFQAQKKVDTKAPQIPNDVEHFEAYKRLWIDMMDNDFTDLFDSNEFGENYGRLVEHEMELTKRWNNIADVILKSANLPSKKEIEEVYKQMYTLKRRVSALESEVMFSRKRKAEAKKPAARTKRPGPGSKDKAKSGAAKPASRTKPSSAKPARKKTG